MKRRKGGGEAPPQRGLRGGRPQELPSEAEPAREGGNPGSLPIEVYARILTEKSRDLMLLVGGEGEVLYVSPSVGPILEYEPDEVLGASIFDYVHPADLSLATAFYYGRADAGDAPRHITLRVRHRDGTWRHLECAGNNLIDDPSVKGIVVNARDVTERIEAERALERSEEYFRSLTENSYDVVTIIGADGTMDYLSPSILPISGYEPQELLGRSVLEFVHPDDVPDIVRVLTEGADIPGAVRRAEFRWLHKDGSWHFHEATGKNALNDPSVKGIIVHSNDITERKRLEEELQRSEEYFRSLTERSSDIIAVIDAEGYLSYASPSVSMAGYSVHEVVGENPARFTHPDDLGPGKKLIAAAVRNPGTTYHGELRIRDKDGHYHSYEASLNNLLDNPAVAGIVIHAHDITERKEGERFNQVQRDLAVALSAEASLDETLAISLRGILDATGMDSGAIFLVDEEGGGIDLVHQEGFSAPLADKMGHFDADSLHAETVMAGEPFYIRGGEAPPELMEPIPDDGLLAGAVIPFRSEGRVIGCLVLSSHALVEIPDRNRAAMEILAGQIAQPIARARLLSALRESEERYRLIYGHAQEAIFTYDTELRLLGLNPKACSLVGYDEEELLGRNIFELDILVVDDLERAREVLDGLFVGGVIEQELRFRTKDGSILTADVTSAAVIGQDGRVMAITNVARDITGRKRAEERMERLNACLLALGPDPLENTMDIVRAGEDILGGYRLRYCRMQKGRLSVFPPFAGEDDFEVPPHPEDHIAHHIITSGDESPSFIADIAQAGYDRDPDFAAGGCVSFLGHPVRLRGKTIGALCMFGGESSGFDQEDVNYLSMLARALTIEEERLAHEESIRHFVDIASHELRTPLSIIKGYAEAFQFGDLMDLNEFQMEKIRIINTRADKMSKTINELLDLSRIDRGHFTIDKGEVELEPLIRSAVRQMEEKGAGRAFTVSVAGGTERHPADPEKLVDLLLILLDNAVNYSPPASSIDIEVEGRGGGVVFSVLDRGPGIPEKEDRAVFERFFQLEDSRHHSASGMGLGLYIAREIAEGHGGRIWYEPREGGGSAFRFFLP